MSRVRNVVVVVGSLRKDSVTRKVAQALADLTPSLTFRFVEIGFTVLALALVLGVATTEHWHWDHKTVFSLLGWAVFAALLAGRRWQGWRGRRATRWLYGGAALLLLAYVGSRFVFEVLLHRPAALTGMVS